MIFSLRMFGYYGRKLKNKNPELFFRRYNMVKFKGSTHAENPQMSARRRGNLNK